MTVKKQCVLFSLFVCLFWPGQAKADKTVPQTTSDHSRHEILKQNFSMPEDVIKACLRCHNDAAAQVHATMHWTWLDPDHPESKKGKGGLSFNNFCVAIPSNEPRCTSCHAGFGWVDKDFDFTSEVKVDCLVCHDRTDTYRKFPTKAGYPVSEPTKFEGKMFLPPDYNNIAASVGRPKPDNCGRCHFYGGGGDSVKHGDLDSTLLAPSRNLDVHLSSEGGKFTCQRCHTTEAHKVAGGSYTTAAFVERISLIEDDQVKRIACESCHTATPHKNNHKANDHTDKVACQTCHIPTFAREKATKMHWDWSTAGMLKEGKPYLDKNEAGLTVYDSKKGTFEWAQNVVPTYKWYNGTMDFMILTDTVDASKRIEINHPIGSSTDPKSRIMPFKAHTGKQPFDPGLNHFVVPHLFGNDDTAYWKNFDWPKAIQQGQEAVGLPWSGTYTFVETVYYYPITHMVAPKEKSVACADCHARGGRMEDVTGVWLPGRDQSTVVDILGWLLVVGSLCGVGVHGAMRIIRSPKNSNHKQ